MIVDCRDRARHEQGCTRESGHGIRMNEKLYGLRFATTTNRFTAFLRSMLVLTHNFTMLTTLSLMIYVKVTGERKQYQLKITR